MGQGQQVLNSGGLPLSLELKPLKPWNYLINNHAVT